MTLKAPLNPQDMIPNSMEIFIGYDWNKMLQVGFYKDQDISAGGETVDDVYSNGQLKKMTNGNKLNINFTMHELTPEKRAIVQNGLIELQGGSIAGDVVELLPGNWSFDSSILLKYANANGALATISSAKAIVNGVEETLVKDTDYELGKENIGDCTLVTLLAGGVLTEADMATTKIIITYTITPDTTAKYFTHYVNSLAKPFKMLLINEYEWNGNKRYILQYVDNCQANKAVIAQIADSDNTTAGMPLEITGEIINEKYKGFVTT